MTTARAQARRGDLTVLLPGLAGPGALGGDDSLQAARALTEALQLPGLSALFETGRRAGEALCSPTADGLLAEAFKMPIDEHGQWCAAAVARQGALGDAGQRCWVRADPVHLHPDMGRLVVFPPPMLQLDLAQSSAICDWLNTHELFPGPRLAAVSGSCWLAEVDSAAAQTRTCAPSVAHGQDADRFLPAGAGAAFWHARMNEIAMLLNQCPINDARESRGEAAVNSVWFWGAGALPGNCTAPRPESARLPFAQAYGDHDLLQGLAECAGLAAHGLPADARQWLGAPQAPGGQLLVLDQLQLAACAGDVGAWQLALHTLDAQWLQGLADALRRGTWSQITLHAGTGASVVVRRSAMPRWLRRRRRLAEALAQLREIQSRRQPRARTPGA